MKAERTTFTHKAFALFMSFALVASFVFPPFAFGEQIEVNDPSGAVSMTDTALDESPDDATSSTDPSLDDSLNIAAEGQELAILSATTNAPAVEATVSATTTAATIGETPYATIQAAFNAIAAEVVTSPTDYLINVAAGTYTETLTITQQANKNIVLQGQSVSASTIKGMITIVGGANRTETLTIRDLSVIDTSGLLTSTGSCITLKTSAHNVSLVNCAFSASSCLYSAAIRSASGNPAYNITVNGCTSKNIYGIMQAMGAIQNLTVINCSGSCTSGYLNAVSVSGTCLIDSCEVTSCNKYFVRFGSGTAAGTTACNATISNCTATVGQTGIADDDGVITLRQNSPKNVAVTHCSFTPNGTTISNRLINNYAAANSANIIFDLQNNYWGPNGFSASHILNLADSATVFAGSYIAKITLNANEGVFSNGAIQQTKAIVNFKADGTAAGKITLPSSPIQDERAFLGWYTAPEDGVKVVSDIPNSALSKDMTIHALWGTIDEQIAVVEQKLGDVTEKYASIEEITPDIKDEVNAAVDSLINTTPDTLAEMLKSEEANTIIHQITDLETLYMKANGETVEATQAEFKAVKESIAAVSVSGAALSIPLTDQALHAVLALDSVAVPAAIPSGIDTSSSTMAFDITLNIADQSGLYKQENIQPKAPLTISITLLDPDNALSEERLLIIHYHGEEDPQVIQPTSVTRDGDNLTVTFMLTKLSSVVIAQRALAEIDPTSDDSRSESTVGSESESIAEMGTTQTSARSSVVFSASEATGADAKQNAVPEVTAGTAKNSALSPSSNADQPADSTSEAPSILWPAVVILLVAAAATTAIVVILQKRNMTNLTK